MNQQNTEPIASAPVMHVLVPALAFRALALAQVEVRIK